MKEHKAVEKQILAEMETTRQELIQLLHGMKVNVLSLLFLRHSTTDAEQSYFQQDSTDALANETIKTEEHIARKAAEIVKKQEELHECK